MAMFEATDAGWLLGMIDGAGAELNGVWRHRTSVAMNVMHEGMFSAASVTCSPTYALHEAQFVGEDNASRSSRRHSRPILPQRMQGHGEETEFHRPFLCCSDASGQRIAGSTLS